MHNLRIKVWSSNISAVPSVSDCTASFALGTIPVPLHSTPCQLVSEPQSRRRADMGIVRPIHGCPKPVFALDQSSRSCPRRVDSFGSTKQQVQRYGRCQVRQFWPSDARSRPRRRRPRAIRLPGVPGRVVRVQCRGISLDVAKLAFSTIKSGNRGIKQSLLWGLVWATGASSLFDPRSRLRTEGRPYRLDEL